MTNESKNGNVDSVELQQSEEKTINEEYKIWKKNTPRMTMPTRTSIRLMPR